MRWRDGGCSELGRRGKYLVWDLEDEVHLVQHLRMTGAVLFDPDPEPPHTRVRIELGQGQPAGDRRSAPVRHRRAAARPGGAGGVLRRAARPGAVGRVVHRRAFARSGARANGAGEGVPARSASHRRRRATSTPTRRCSARASTRCAQPDGSPASSTGACGRRRSPRCKPGIDARGATIDDFRHVDGVAGPSRTSFSSTVARASRAGPAARRS